MPLPRKSKPALDMRPEMVPVREYLAMRGQLLLYQRSAILGEITRLEKQLADVRALRDTLVKAPHDASQE